MRMLGAVLALVGLLGVQSGLAAGVDDNPTWQDPTTGLIWSRCPVAMQPQAGTCAAGEQGAAVPTDGYRWQDAMQAVMSLSYLGQLGWRLPTEDELRTVYNDSKLNGNLLFGNFVFWTATAYVPSYDTNCSSGGPVQFNHGFVSDGFLNRVPAMVVVRGGQVPSRYESFNQIAERCLAKDEKEKANAFDMKKALAEQKAADEKRAAEERAFNQAKANKKQAQAKRTAELRKSAKAGDKTAQGLVLEVKGPLVKVQGYERVCTSRSNDRDPQSLCLRWKEVPSTVGWVKKAELSAPE